MKLVFEGKISLEGSMEEVRSHLATFLAQTVSQLSVEGNKTEEVAPTPEPISIASDVPSIENPVMTGETIVTRVLTFIAENPAKTTEEIASGLSISPTQAKTAVLSLKKKERIVPANDDQQRNSGWKKAEAIKPMKKPIAKPATVEVAPVGINNTILDFMRKNPGLTAREIANKSNTPYDRVTSLVHGLKTNKKATITGKGGHHDPYRYSIV